MKAQTSKLLRYPESIRKAGSTDELLGLEGSASASYFQIYRKFLKNDFGFRKRIKHPPPDPVNILLSLGYTLLFNFFHSMVNVVGLDPYQGYFHKYKFGHAAMASDLMEPFRAPVVDGLVLRVINLGIIKKKDFKKREGWLSLTKEGLQKYLAEYDGKLRSTRSFKPVRKVLDYSQIIEWQCRHLARVLLGKDQEYRAFTWRG